MPKPADILFLIDIQNTFALQRLGAEQGGSLYVPGGEKAGGPAADLVRHMKGSTIILSQDFHPADHISFASNHKGVKPFTDIYIRKENGMYRTVAADIGGAATAVTTNEAGYITSVLDKPASLENLKDTLRTTLWLTHGVQGTRSSLFVDPVMGELPAVLDEALRNDLSAVTLEATDYRGNEFHVVRKGVHSDLHSYGIATEDDLKSKTDAPKVFQEIAARLGEKGIREANIYIGGLATNYCVEFSHNDIYGDFLPLLKKQGIEAKVHLLTDISFGIPVSVPGGAWPDLEAAPQRMAAYGTKTTTTNELMRRLMRQKPVDLIKHKPEP